MMTSPLKSSVTSVALLAILASLAGCRLLPDTDRDGKEGVVRYAGQEVSATGALVLSSEVVARRAADSGAATVEVLPPGTSVERRAQHGAFTLIAWVGPDGVEHTGWITNDIEKVSGNVAANPAVVGPVVQVPNPGQQTKVNSTKCTGGKIFDGTRCKCPAATAWNGSSCVEDTKCTGGKVFDGTSCRCPAATAWNGSSCVEETKCTGGKVFDGTSCKCPTSTKWNGSSCVEATPTCTGGKVFNGTSCACPASTEWNGSSCVTPAPKCTGGKVWNGSACACPPGSNWNGSTCARPTIKF